MPTSRTFHALVAVAVAMVGVSCGDDDSADSTTSTTITTTTEAAATTAETTVTFSETTTTPTTLAPPTTAEAATAVATTTDGVIVAQSAIWPAADVMFATPEETAADFVVSVLGVEPLLGEYVGGDSRSGEIEVLSPGETRSVSRGLLNLRMLAPNDGWFVISAANPNAAISSPEAYAVVPAGPLAVEGVARGHEGTVVVTAFLAGHADAIFDQIITAGGALETPEEYRVSVDLTGAAPGDVITLLVRGDTGLENDPGEFGAIAVVIGD